MDSGSRPHDVSNDIMKSAVLKMSNDDISGIGHPIDLVFDCRLGFSGTAD